jgi:adenylate cyclase
MPARRILVIIGLGLFVFLGVSLLDLMRPFAYVRLCDLCRDAVSRAGRTTAANPDLVFLGIDAASVNLDEGDIDDLFGLSGDNSKEAHALRLMSRRFPWSREVYALVLERLLQAGARVVAFDLTFPGPTDDDPLFRAALDRYSDRVVIGSNFVDGSLTRPSETLLPQTSPIDKRIGFTNFWADEDDVVRCARYHVTFEQVRATKIRPNSERFASLATIALRKAGFANTVPDDFDNHALRFTAPPRQGFPSHSLFEIFVPAYWQQNYQSGEFFRGKIVVVGADGNWQHDEHPTPFGNMPGAELHLNAINAALHHEFVRELPAAGEIACCAIAAIAAIFLSTVLRLPWLRLLITMAISASVVWMDFVCFSRFSIFLPMVAPLTAMNATMLLGLVCDFTSERLEKARLRRTLERYVSRDVVYELMNRPRDYAETLGGVVRPAAILFCDIRSYSAVAAGTSPDVLVAQLNEYFTSMVECVFECGGTLDKFIGDALMAVWGTLHSQGAQQDAISAVRAALLMRKKLAELNLGWQAKGWAELRVGTGVNYGEVVAGNIGSPQRMEFTVIGDAVNFSWELQEMTKQHHCDIILSSSIATLVAGHFALRSLGTVPVGQIKRACEIYELEPDVIGRRTVPHPVPAVDLIPVR